MFMSSVWYVFDETNCNPFITLLVTENDVMLSLSPFSFARVPVNVNNTSDVGPNLGRKESKVIMISSVLENSMASDAVMELSPFTET